jgi:butyrate kinase
MASKKTIISVYPTVHSTKLAVYNENYLVLFKEIVHPFEELKKFEGIPEQTEYRKQIILEELGSCEMCIENVKAIVGRGGLIRPVKAGIYTINERMKKQLISGKYGKHEANLGGLIADSLLQEFPDAVALTANPVVVDELGDLARVSGHPLFERRSVFHALNHDAVARRYADSIQRDYYDMNIIVAHIGRGISVGAHKKGKVTDVNQAFDGDGAFSIETSGTLPSGPLVHLCFSGEHTEKEIEKMITSKGGLFAYLGSDSMKETEKMVIDGDDKAKFYFRAMAYQTAKEIGSMSTVLSGNIDAIILTGEGMLNEYFAKDLISRISFLAKVISYPGENETEALAKNALRALKGETDILEY